MAQPASPSIAVPARTTHRTERMTIDSPEMDSMRNHLYSKRHFSWLRHRWPGTACVPCAANWSRYLNSCHFGHGLQVAYKTRVSYHKAAEAAWVELIKKTPASAPAPDRLDWPLSYIHVQWRECQKDVKIPGITGVVRYMRCNGRALPLRLRLADSRNAGDRNVRDLPR